MTIGLLIRIALAVARNVPGVVDVAKTAAQAIKDAKAALPPITHEDGTPISLEDLDANVDALALKAHASWHAGESR